MGGHGSGRRVRWDTRALTIDRLRLDVRELARAGHLEQHGARLSLTWSTGANVVLYPTPDAVVLAYRWRSDATGGEWRDAAERVPLDWTEPNYGGRRPWWRCPVCGVRVAILYGAARFLCRRCSALAYPSQNENEGDRALRRANKIRARLGGRPGMLNAFPPRPKGMHHATYRRLRWEVEDAEMRGMLELTRYLERADRRLSRLNLNGLEGAE